MQHQKSTRSGPTEVAEVVEGVEVDVVEAPIVKDQTVKHQVVSLLQLLQDPGELNIQTFPQEIGQGVVTISDMEKELTFAQNPLHVRGRISTLQDPPSETGTSSVTLIQLY